MALEQRILRVRPIKSKPKDYKLNTSNKVKIKLHNSNFISLHCIYYEILFSEMAEF